LERRFNDKDRINKRGGKMKVETTKGIWKTIEYTNKWNDLITKHNWRLMGISEDGFILMKRDGYINRFKEADK